MVILRPDHWLVVSLETFVMAEELPDGRLAVDLLLPAEDGKAFQEWARERMREQDHPKDGNGNDGANGNAP